MQTSGAIQNRPTWFTLSFGRHAKILATAYWPQLIPWSSGFGLENKILASSGLEAKVLVLPRPWPRWQNFDHGLVTLVSTKALASTFWIYERLAVMRWLIVLHRQLLRQWNPDNRLTSRPPRFPTRSWWVGGLRTTERRSVDTWSDTARAYLTSVGSTLKHIGATSPSETSVSMRRRLADDQLLVLFVHLITACTVYSTSCSAVVKANSRNNGNGQISIHCGHEIPERILMKTRNM